MIKKWTSTVLFLILCFLLQTTLMQKLKLAGVIPNLLLILTVSTGYLRGCKDGLITGMLCGILSDMVFGSVIGLHALFYLLIGYLNGYGNNIYFGNNFSVPLLLVGISDIVYGLMYYVFEFLLRGRLWFVYYLKAVILPEAVYSMLVAIILFKLLSIVDRLVMHKDSKEAF